MVALLVGGLCGATGLFICICVLALRKVIIGRSQNICILNFRIKKAGVQFTRHFKDGLILLLNHRPILHSPKRVLNPCLNLHLNSSLKFQNVY